MLAKCFLGLRGLSSSVGSERGEAVQPSPAQPSYTCSRQRMPQPPDPALTAVPWKSLPRLFWKMIWIFHNCSWRQCWIPSRYLGGELTGAYIGQSCHPAAPLPYHRLWSSRNEGALISRLWSAPPTMPNRTLADAQQRIATDSFLLISIFLH